MTGRQEEGGTRARFGGKKNVSEYQLAYAFKPPLVIVIEGRRWRKRNQD